MDSLADKTSTSPLRPFLWLLSFSPWIKLFGAVLAFVLISLYCAIHSELGSQISTGESLGFSWVRTHIDWLLLIGLGYLIFASAFQHLWFQVNGKPYHRATRILAGLELISLGILAAAILSKIPGAQTWGHILLQVTLFLQVILGIQFSHTSESDLAFNILDDEEKSPLLFLSFLFLIAVVPTYLDPSWQRLHDYVRLDSTFEYLLCRL